MCRKWADECVAKDSTYFSKLAGSQAPEYLYIGCADSRVAVRCTNSQVAFVRAIWAMSCLIGQ